MIGIKGLFQIQNAGTGCRELNINVNEEIFTVHMRRHSNKERIAPGIVHVPRFGKVLLIAGGFRRLTQGKELLDCVDVHDLATDSWSILPQRLSQQKINVSSCLVGAFIYAVCGCIGKQDTNLIERLHQDGLRYENIPWEAI